MFRTFAFCIGSLLIGELFCRGNSDRDPLDPEVITEFEQLCEEMRPFSCRLNSEESFSRGRLAKGWLVEAADQKSPFEVGLDEDSPMGGGRAFRIVNLSPEMAGQVYFGLPKSRAIIPGPVPAEVKMPRWIEARAGHTLRVSFHFLTLGEGMAELRAQFHCENGFDADKGIASGIQVVETFREPRTDLRGTADVYEVVLRGCAKEWQEAQWTFAVLGGKSTMNFAFGNRSMGEQNAVYIKDLRMQEVMMESEDPMP